MPAIPKEKFDMGIFNRESLTNVINQLTSQWLIQVGGELQNSNSSNYYSSSSSSTAQEGHACSIINSIVLLMLGWQGRRKYWTKETFLLHLILLSVDYELCLLNMLCENKKTWKEILDIFFLIVFLALDSTDLTIT